LVGVRVARTHDRLLVLEIARAYSTTVSARDAAFEERNEENAALRVLAKKMAEVADSAQLLDILCEAASAQCDATGGAVIHMGDMQGDIVAATGSMAVARGRRFPLAGSLAGEAISSRAAVSVDDFGRSDRPLARTMPELAVGPLLVAPLYAHDTAIGAIAVVRAENAVAFSAREAQRLHVIADHASLALWKAELLEQAQAADQAKGRFLATISHELRTPLTALSGYEELLVDQVLGPLHESQRDVLERMRSITQHLAALIEEVLAFSSLEAGRESVRPTEFLAADLLRSAAAIIEPLVRQKHLQLHVDAPDDPIRITSDIDKLRQILVNLAGNAVKFTDTGHVRFAVRRAGPEIRFAVEDTGIGIAPADAHRLFRPFMQLDTGLTRRHGGTGLGLYISQRLARLLDGRIELQSTPGQGSTFALLVPA
jgi:signal transduction histidine kinase